MNIPKGYKLVLVDLLKSLLDDPALVVRMSSDKIVAIKEALNSAAQPQPIYDEAKGPVGCRYRKIDKRERAWTYREGVAKTPWEGWEVEPLYTHVDAGEVDHE